MYMCVVIKEHANPRVLESLGYESVEYETYGPFNSRSSAMICATAIELQKIFYERLRNRKNLSEKLSEKRRCSIVEKLRGYQELLKKTRNCKNTNNTYFIDSDLAKTNYACSRVAGKTRISTSVYEMKNTDKFKHEWFADYSLKRIARDIFGGPEVPIPKEFTVDWPSSISSDAQLTIVELPTLPYTGKYIGVMKYENTDYKRPSHSTEIYGPFDSKAAAVDEMVRQEFSDNSIHDESDVDKKYVKRYRILKDHLLYLTDETPEWQIDMIIAYWSSLTEKIVGSDMTDEWSGYTAEIRKFGS